MQEWRKRLLFVVGVVLVVGLFEALFRGVFFKELAWWQVLLAIPAIGIAYIALEYVGMLIDKAFGVHHDFDEAKLQRHRIYWYGALFTRLIVIGGLLFGGFLLWVRVVSPAMAVPACSGQS